MITARWPGSRSGGMPSSACACVPRCAAPLPVLLLLLLVVVPLLSEPLQVGSLPPPLPLLPPAPPPAADTDTLARLLCSVSGAGCMARRLLRLHCTAWTAGSWQGG